MQNSENTYVFVVCGSSEHIETLHFSLNYLKKNTENEILVLTDQARNETPIRHKHIVDVKAPSHFTHHQASIFLKTGIHLFLPKGKTYCYLDTDVVALKDDIDNIFSQYKTPITFAPDHCTLPVFSPYAVNCACLENYNKEVQNLEKVLKIYDKNQELGTEEIAAQKRLIQSFNRQKQNKFKYLLIMIRYAFARKKFPFGEFYFDKKLKTWFEIKTNKAVLFDFSRIAKLVANNSPFRWNKLKRMWVNAKNENIYHLSCNHLKEYIKADLGINVNERNWQHWNGGVFLFNDDSHEFLSAWHKKTLEIFEFANWKTRDQGTLIATVWEFGLERQKTLSKKWNFIADYNKDGLDFNDNGTFTDNHWKTKHEASFIHIYHHWGDENWKLWNWVRKQANF